MKRFGQIVATLAVILALGAMVFGLEWMGIAWKGFFGPKHAKVERQVFEQTKSFVDSKKHDLVRYHTQFVTADSVTEKNGIASAIRHMFVDIDERQLSPDLAEMLSTMRNYHGLETKGLE